MDVEIFPRLLNGTVLTVRIAVFAMIFATILSIVLGLARLIKPWPIRWLVRGYLEFFRGTSLLVQLFWMYYVLPHFGILIDPIVAGILGISLNASAYGAEAVRGAILAVPKPQYEAAVALNISPWRRMRRIIMPQAMIMLLPPWGNMLIDILKATSVVSLITISDLTFEAYQLNALTFRTIQIFLLVLAIYFVLAQILAFGVKALEVRAKRGIALGSI